MTQTATPPGTGQHGISKISKRVRFCSSLDFFQPNRCQRYRAPLRIVDKIRHEPVSVELQHRLAKTPLVFGRIREAIND